MGVDVFSPLGSYRTDTMGVNNPVTELAPDGFFSGTPSAIGKGAVGGLAAVGRVVGDAFAQAGKAEAMNGMLMNPSTTDEQWKQMQDLQPVAPFDEQLKAVQDWSKLDPRIYGPGAATVGGLTRGLTIFGLGTLAGGPATGAATLGVTEGYQNYRDLREAGVDEDTAAKSAVVTGGLAAAGAFLPMGMPGNLVKGVVGKAVDLAVASGANTVFGMGSRAATSAVLESGGYHDMAAQYRAFDGEAMAADAVLGAAFGAWSHVERGIAGKRGVAEVLERPTPDLVEKALDIRREEAINRGAAGIPKDLPTAQLDRELQDRAVLDLLQGRSPEVSPEEARQVADGALVDPQKVQLAQDIEAAAQVVHGPLADPTIPDVRVEAPEPFAPKLEPLTEPPPKAAEPTGPQLDPVVQSQVDQIVARHPDMDIQMPDGSVIKASQLQDKIRQNLALAESESKLHDVAVACFLRTL